MGADTFFGFHLFSNPKIQVAQLVPTASCNWVFPLLSVVVHQTGRLTALQPERQENQNVAIVQVGASQTVSASNRWMKSKGNQQGNRTPTVAMWVRTKFKNGC